MTKYSVHRYRRKRKFIKFFLLIGVFLSIILFVDFKLRLLVKSYSCSRASAISTAAVNNAILGEFAASPAEYADLVITTRGENGEISSVSANIQKINILKSRISLGVSEKISNLDPKEIGIPLGNLTNLEFLNERGPVLPIKLSVLGSVSIDFTSDFSESGINQTRHRIILNIRVHLRTSAPGSTSVNAIETNVPVTETIIVGKVPVFYGSLHKTAS